MSMKIYADKDYVEEQLVEKISVPSVAEVGQTIVVKAVDANGKPIEWEATSFPTLEVDGVVKYDEVQNLTTDERAQARKNIQKYDWREGTFGGVLKIKYCDVSESIDWEVAANMLDALGYNNNIVDYMAQMAKLVFESAITANNDTMINNIVTNYKALRDAGGLSNSSIIIGFPDNDDNLGFSIQMYTASNDANKITIKIYDNNLHSNVKTGYWIANSDGTVTKSISAINIDTALAKQGFYADAKAVGDAIETKIDKSEVEEIDALEIASEMGLILPAAAEDGSIYADEDGALYSL